MMRAEVARTVKEGLPLYTQPQTGLLVPMRQVVAVMGHGVVEFWTGIEPVRLLITKSVALPLSYQNIEAARGAEEGKRGKA